LVSAIEVRRTGLKELKGKTALLTGVSRGIGPYIAKALAREGVNLAIAARTAEPLKALALEMTNLGVRVVAFPTDITVEAERISLIKRTQEKLGSIDILVNNAGVVDWTSFDLQQESEITRIITTNLIAPMLLTRMVLPQMLARKSGHIVTIASLSGKKGVPYEATYSASKAGLIQWCNALYMELEGAGVGVSVVIPSYVLKVGMAASETLPPPKSGGAVPPEQVAVAVIKSILENKQEVIVRRGPTRIMYALNECSPAIGNYLLKKLGVVEHQRIMANQAKSLKDVRHR
jgi:short-subunit dehydrogenase